MYLFTGKDICTLARMPASTLNEWVDKDLIKPAVKGGRGPGNAGQYTFMQALGILVGVAQRQTQRGCVLPYVQSIVNAFAAIDEDELKEHFAEGDTHLAMVHYDRPFFRHKEFDWIDVETLYSKLVSYRKRMERQLARSK
jgi:hypothetical protein